MTLLLFLLMLRTTSPSGFDRQIERRRRVGRNRPPCAACRRTSRRLPSTATRTGRTRTCRAAAPSCPSRRRCSGARTRRRARRARATSGSAWLKVMPRWITAARPVDERRVVVDLEVREHGLRRDADAAARRIRHELELHGLEVHQQRVRHDVVGAIRLAVERAGIGLVDGEIAVVEHEIARDLGEPHAPQRAQQLPDFLDDELRVAVALDPEVAVELLAVEARPGNRPRSATCRRAQVLERAPRRDDLHDGRRAARHVGEVAQRGLRVVERLDDDADLGRRESRAPSARAATSGGSSRRMRGERSRADQRKSSRSHGGGFCPKRTASGQRRDIPVRRRTDGTLR